jgi:small-conductance mechanosensitive channel/CRP-like cAMP-binding protein
MSNHKTTITTIILPACLVLLLALLTVFDAVPVSFVGQDASNTTRNTYRDLLRIGLFLSSVFLLIRLMNVFVWERFVTRLLHTPVPRLIKDLVAAVIVILGIIIVVGPILGKSVTGIWATSGAIGVVVGFALRGLILDVFTGIAINVDGSYRIGDWVHIHARNTVEYIGCISEINWRTTRLKTTENNIVVLPNSIIGLSVVTNFSAPDALSRFELLFHLDFSIPTDRCLRLLLAGAKQAIDEDGIVGDPEPKVKVNKVTDLGVEYMVRYWLYPAKTSPSRGRHLVIKNILDNLRVAGVSLAYPKQDLFYAAMPARDIDVRSQQDKINILASIELFSAVQEEVVRELAEEVETADFQASDVIFRSGDKGHSMFIVVEGLLDVYVLKGTKQQEIKVNTISAGEFLGEMSLFTGEPRTATVVASTDVVLYEITFDHMRRLFDQNPDTIYTISQVIADRHIRTAHVLKRSEQAVPTQDRKKISDDILFRIKNFFGFMRDSVTSHRRHS